MAKKTDQKILDLIKEVNKKKSEIAKLEKPNWLTNCSFMWFEGNTTGAINLHVEGNLKTLVGIAGHLLDKQRSLKEAAAHLNVDLQEYTWCGFPINDWLQDVATRIKKIQISTERKKLEALESRLNAIVTPELRAELELQAIEEELR